MLARLVFAFLLTLPFSIPTLVAALEAEQQMMLTIRLWSSTSGVLQVYFDTGAGFGELQSTRLPLEASAAAVDYRLPMAPEIYKAIRIDPSGGPGRFVLEGITVTAGSGEEIAVIPLDQVRAAYELIEDSRNADRLVVDAPPGAFDPQLVYQPPTPLPLLPGVPPLGRQLSLSGLSFIGGLLFVYGLERALKGLSAPTLRAIDAITRFGAAHPGPTILIVAALATIIDTYPVLLFERSFVSPNNGGTLMLYDHAPFVPGNADVEIEDMRGGDVGAMMWAFVPYSKMQRQALAEGEFPLWNRYNSAGRPLWAQGQTFLFDPLHWLTLVGADPAPGWDLKFVSHRLVFASGIGMAVLAATGAWLPASVAAFSAPFISVLAYRFNHPAAFAVSYLPWILVSWFLLARSTDRRSAMRAGVLLAITSALAFLASPPKEATLLIGSAQATGLLGVLLMGGPLRLAGMRIGVASAAGVAFVLLTTPHWLTFLDALRESMTASDEPAVYVVGRPYLMGFVLGPLMPGNIFVGTHLLMLVLGAAALCAPGSFFRHRLLIAPVLVGTVLLAMAFGVVPVEWMVRVPLLASIQHVWDIGLTGASVLSLVAGAAGTLALLNASAMRLAFATLVTAMAAAFLISRLFIGLTPHRFGPWAALIVGMLATTLPLLVLGVRRRHGGVLPIVATLVAAVAVLLPGGLHLETGNSAVDRILLQPRPRAALDADSPSVESIHRATMEPGRAVGLNVSLYPGSQALYQLEGIGGPDALQLPAYESLVDAGGILRAGPWLTVVTTPDVNTLAPLLDMLNVQFLVGRPDDAPADLAVEPVVQPDVIRGLRRPSPWPRAFFVDRVSSYTDPADLMSQVAAHRGPMAAVQSTDSRATSAVAGLSATESTIVRAEGYRLTTNTTSFRVRAPAAGIVVLTEAFMAGDFVATLNGQEAPYFRVNHAFKAVRIPGPGDWDVRFEYRPARWRLAWGIAGLGGLILIAMAVAAWLPSRVAQGAPAKGSAP